MLIYVFNVISILVIIPTLISSIMIIFKRDCKTAWFWFITIGNMISSVFNIIYICSEAKNGVSFGDELLLAVLHFFMFVWMLPFLVGKVKAHR